MTRDTYHEECPVKRPGLVPRQLSASGPRPRARRALILAAGASSRFVPISLDYPKALAPVRGQRLLERLIQQLLEAGIEEIYLLLGYKADCYQELARRYSLRCIENPDYATCNNISTLYYARHLLEEAYICVNDLYSEVNPFLLGGPDNAVEDPSFYDVVYSPTETEEWCVELSGRGEIQDVHIGAQCGYYLQGHAYFNRDFGRRFGAILEEYYGPQKRSRARRDWYWENLYAVHRPELPLYARCLAAQSLHEFDRVEDLLAFDPDFLRREVPPTWASLAAQLRAPAEDLKAWDLIREGTLAVGCSFSCRGRRYRYLLSDRRLELLEEE